MWWECTVSSFKSESVVFFVGNSGQETEAFKKNMVVLHYLSMFHPLLCGLDVSLFKPREIRTRSKDDVSLFQRSNAAKNALHILEHSTVEPTHAYTEIFR